MPGPGADFPQSGLTGLVLGRPQPAGNQIPTVLAALGTAASSGAPQKANGGGTSREALPDSRNWVSRAERGRTRNSWRAQGRRGPQPHDTWVPDLDHPSLHLHGLPLQRPSLSPHQAHWVCQVRGRAGHVFPQTSALTVAGGKHICFWFASRGASKSERHVPPTQERVLIVLPAPADPLCSPYPSRRGLLAALCRRQLLPPPNTCPATRG